MSSSADSDGHAALGRWVFGYGSLVWRPAFPYLRKVPGYLEGWSRRFWQGSTDHRGVPGAPGRVVTLVPTPGARCYGMVYRVGAEVWPAVSDELDVREKGGYERRLERIVLVGGTVARHSDDHERGSARSEVTALVYLATENNANYLGPAPLDAIAAQVRSSRGPSGDNVEYVVRLGEALRKMKAPDEHVFALLEALGERASTA